MGGLNIPRLRIAILSLIVIVLFITSSARLGAQGQTLIIEGGTLIDGTGKNAAPNSAIIIEGNRIKAVGRKGDLSYPANAKLIKVEGKTILPGFIDGHIHFTAWMAPLFLHFGVTTVYDTANPTDWILAQRDAINAGKIKGPRMFVTGVVVDGPEETSDMNHPAERGGYRVHIRTPEEGREMVRQLAAQKVDAIKVHEGLSSELLKGVVDEAHRLGLEAIGHSKNTREATLAGLKFIEHMNPIVAATSDTEEGEGAGAANMNTQLFDSLIELCVKNGVYFNPTIWGNRYWTRVASPHAKEWAALVAKFHDDPALTFVPRDERNAWLRAAPTPKNTMNARQEEQQAKALKNTADFIKRYAAAGGKFVAGPDTGGYDHAMVAGLALHLEMETLVDLGLTPMQAIQSVTKWPAELLHKEKDLGTVEAGKIADLIVIDGDPLVNISRTRNIALVIKDGQVIDTSLDPSFKNPLPRPVYIDPATQGPEVSGITPKAAHAGDTEVLLRLNGKNFKNDSLVRFDVTDLPTQFVSTSELSAKVSTVLLKKFGTYAITVVNPGSGGGTSVPAYFLVNFNKD
jgi:imidazolonepropionase-like amidohydrolase